MRAEILAVGTELLLGDIVNSNAQYIAQRLAEMGILVYNHSVVGDNEDRLMDAYRLAFGRADLVVATGGLGPTKDDLTKETGAKFFGLELEQDHESYEKLVRFFAKRNMPVSEGNRKQALFPAGSTILRNDNGTAPGCIINREGKILVMLPGPPKEMVPMFEQSVMPYLQSFSDGTLHSKVLRVCGIGEGNMAEMIGDIIDKQDNPTVAPYAKEGEATLRITAKAATLEEAEKLIIPTEKRIREILGDNIYGAGDTSLEQVVGEMLVEKALSIAVAESCTGGLLAGRLINYPGISAVFKEGVVAYSNEAKVSRLKVSTETLDEFGAVSSETAAEMARGIALSAGTDIGISTTGIAGPTGATETKPIGLVYLGMYINGTVKTKELNLWGDRQKIRERAVVSALDWLRRELYRLG